ncbi:Flp pilus assembly protein TadG [Sphingomonas sp. BE138]|uniref:TadE/TadG family type IV pilus assembly protein n=1 Tax=Sphingomonas sp. BE138 TaxID=2817845 RepID=UPI0028646C30|nr:pilus assembly protein [Sphingomonas sp. BE138]MDR6790540.1 Flp pilus assembly protein TadG [Sphingomonas sp. BE138]
MRFAIRTLELRRDRRGATLIEFAIVAMPFFALLIATLQTSIAFFAQQCLDTTAEDTGRQLVTGAVQKAGMSQSDFKALACKNLPAFMSCANLMIDVQSATEFSSVGTTAPTLTYDTKDRVTNAWQFAPGGPGSVVVMRVMYLLPVVGGPLGFNLATERGGQRLLVSTSVFKSEPYAS